jgi:hypothetical protein
VTSVDSGAGEKAALSAEDKKAKLAKFQSHLKPRGEAFHAPKSLQPNSVVRPHLAPSAQTSAPKKAAAPKSETRAAAPKAAKSGAAKTAAATKAPAKKAPKKD